MSRSSKVASSTYLGLQRNLRKGTTMREMLELGDDVNWKTASDLISNSGRNPQLSKEDFIKHLPIQQLLASLKATPTEVLC